MKITNYMAAVKFAQKYFWYRASIHIYDENSLNLQIDRLIKAAFLAGVKRGSRKR